MRLLATMTLLLAMMTSVCFAAEPTMPEELQNNTVVLGDERGHGSGVLWTRTECDRQVTFIWTAGHVADAWGRPDGTFRPVPVIQGDKRGMARVLRAGDSEAGVDVALLEVVSGDFVGTAKFYRGFDEVEVGQRILHCGSPLDRDWNQRLVSYGRFSYVDRLVDGWPMLAPHRFDQVDLTAAPGCSGGPVIDAETSGIVGLLVRGSGPGLAIIEPTRNIYQWAKEHDCLWAFDPTVSMPATIPPWPSDIFLRTVHERYCPLDNDWGERPPVEEEDTLGAIIDAVLKAIGESGCQPPETDVQPDDLRPTPAESPVSVEPVEPPVFVPPDEIIIDLPVPDDADLPTPI